MLEERIADVKEDVVGIQDTLHHHRYLTQSIKSIAAEGVERADETIRVVGEVVSSTDRLRQELLGEVAQSTRVAAKTQQATSEALQSLFEESQTAFSDELHHRLEEHRLKQGTELHEQHSEEGQRLLNEFRKSFTSMSSTLTDMTRTELDHARGADLKMLREHREQSIVEQHDLYRAEKADTDEMEARMSMRTYRAIREAVHDVRDGVAHDVGIVIRQHAVWPDVMTSHDIKLHGKPGGVWPYHPPRPDKPMQGDPDAEAPKGMFKPSRAAAKLAIAFADADVTQRALDKADTATRAAKGDRFRANQKIERHVASVRAARATGEPTDVARSPAVGMRASMAGTPVGPLRTPPGGNRPKSAARKRPATTV